MNILIHGYEERNCNCKVSHFHYLKHARLEAACMEHVTLKYEAVSPSYTLCLS